MTLVLRVDFYQLRTQGWGEARHFTRTASRASACGQSNKGFKHMRLRYALALSVMGFPAGKSSQRTQHENQQRSSEQQRGALPPLESALRKTSRRRGHTQPGGSRSCRSRPQEPACQTLAALTASQMFYMMYIQRVQRCRLRLYISVRLQSLRRASLVQPVFSLTGTEEGGVQNTP